VSDLVTVVFIVPYRVYAGVARLPQDQGFLGLGSIELSSQGWTALIDPYRGFVMLPANEVARIHVTRVAYVLADSVPEKLICLTYDRSQMLSGDVPFVVNHLNINGTILDEPPPFIGDLESCLDGP
jgi:hypothetical protein